MWKLRTFRDTLSCQIVDFVTQIKNWTFLLDLACLCVHLLHEGKSFVLFKRKWYLSGSWEQCRWELPATETPKKPTPTNEGKRKKSYNIQFMKFLEWPFFFETCLELLRCSFRRMEDENMQHEARASNAGISSRLVPFAMSIRSHPSFFELLELLK